MKILILLLLTALVLPAADSPATVARIVYFKAKPGQLEAYNRYLKHVAEPIDEEARKAGAYVSVQTFYTSDPASPWTHMRIFWFSSRAQEEAASKMIEDAKFRLYPDEKKRQEITAQRDALRAPVGKRLILDIIP